MQDKYYQSTKQPNKEHTELLDPHYRMNSPVNTVLELCFDICQRRFVNAHLILNPELEINAENEYVSYAKIWMFRNHYHD